MPAHFDYNSITLTAGAQCKQKGFTLVELLVVITIIAILSVIGITVFTGVQKGARDARRRGDIDAISKAMEVHFGECQVGAYCNVSPTYFAGGQYPTDPGGGGCGDVNGSPTACQYCFLGDGDLDYKHRGTNNAHKGCGQMGSWARCGDPGNNSLCNNYIICANLETSWNGKKYYCIFSQQ